MHAGPADLGLQRRGRALGDDLAVVDDPDPVGEQICLLEVLGREEDRDAVFPGEPGDLVPERAAALRVEPGGGLVEEEDPRAVDEREGQVEAALHAARVAADLPVGRLRQADALEQRVGALPAVGPGEPLQRRLQAQVVSSREERVERRLLERGADHRAHLGALVHDVVARYPGRPRGRRQQRREHEHRRRLAGAVRPEEPVDLARLDAYVDAVDGSRTLLELANELLDLDAVLPCRHGISRYLDGRAAPRTYAGAQLLSKPESCWRAFCAVVCTAWA